MSLSPQETQVLQDFLDQLVQAKGVVKDPQAQDLISLAVARQPDADYLLVQRALLLDQALANAQTRIEQLQRELADAKAERPAARSGFLDPAAAWGNSAASKPLGQGYQTSAAGTPLPAAPAYEAQPARSGFFGGQGGGMLGNVAAGVAGMAAGAFLFQGLGGLLGNSHGTSAASLGQDGATAGAASAASAPAAENGLIDNYFADKPKADAGHDNLAQNDNFADDFGDAGAMDDFDSV